MKGQINFEFLVAAALYLLAVGTVILNSSSFIPDYRDSLDSASKHTEARAITSTMLTEPGSHTYGAGGENWEKNLSTQSSISGFGVALGFHELDLSKVETLNTVGESGLNYTEFRRVSGVANQYRMRFVLLPVVETPREFRKDDPPNSPNIRTPRTTEFSRAGNTVHYGNETVGGRDIRVLATSHDGAYDTAYLSGDDDWDFNDPQTESRSVGDKVRTPEVVLTLDAFQNRRNDKGAAVFFSGDIKVFGASPDVASDIVSLDRYAELKGEPVRVEVLAW